MLASNPIPIGRNPLGWRVALALTAAMSCLPLAAHAGFEKRLTVTADALELVDLVGEVRLESTDGTAYEIIATVDGRDATEDRVTLEQQPGDPARVLVRFPVEEERTYVYPRLGGGSSSQISMSDLIEGNRDWLDWILHGADRQIKIHSHGSGLELWADVTIRVPAGKRTIARLGVGTIDAQGITGDVTLDTQAGPVTAARITGAFVADTGSGSVNIADCTGPEILVDTGSGGVEASRVKCESLSIDTGSGSVELTQVDVRNLMVDTGSGGVSASEIGADAFNIDTGAGSVNMAMTRLGSGDFRIDTGSGGISLTLPAAAVAQVHAETGSGPITYDSADDKFRAEDEIDFRIGDGGSAKINLETGSGGIRIRQ